MAGKSAVSKQYHHGALRQALVDMVLTMVAERGDAAELTLREVARRVGVSHNAPYRHFEDKDALLAAVATEGFHLLSRELRAARAGIAEAEERFVRTGLAYLAFARQHRGYLAVMHGPDVAKGRTAALQNAANDTFQILKDAALDAGEVDVVEARRLGTVAWSFLYGTAMLANNRQIPPTVSATPEHLVELGARHLFHSFRQQREPGQPPR
jgi:AcrR family transcriptional regulator